MKKKLILFGIDGAAYPILNRFIKQGVMPNFKMIMSKGAWGVLESTQPPYTPPAWTTIATGVNPGKHGIIGLF